jgi:pyruvate kinase
MKRTKIIATVGPATDDPGTIRKLILAGVDVFRLNFSHGDHASHRRRLDIIRKVARKENRHIAVMQDLQGPKIRVGELQGGILYLRAREAAIVTTRNVMGGGDVIPSHYKSLAKDVSPGDRILMDDGLMELRVESVDGKDVYCTVIKGGALKEHKGMNLPGVDISQPSLTRKDIIDLKAGLAMGVDFVAMSFVRWGKDMEKLRKLVKSQGADVQLIAKIERPEGVHNLDEILEHADGVMVARGDLGVEMAPEKVPGLQKRIIEKANEHGKHAITATQMLESMIHNPRPTRAEASDVANAVLDGTGAVMLSGETAAGEYPVETVLMMARIVKEAEVRLLKRNTEIPPVKVALQPNDFSAAVARAAVRAANDLGAHAILSFTQSGTTAELVSKYRPQCMVIGGTLHEAVARRMALTWGVTPVLFDKISNTESLVADVDDRLLKTKLLKWGDLIVITTGVPVGRAGTTNMIKIHRMGYSD